MNPINIHYLNLVLGAGSIILQISSVIVLLLLFFVLPAEKRKGEINKILNYIDKHYLALGFFISLAATLFSLVYSDIIHFPPCLLCWWQRIFMYPQVVLFGVALWDKDRKIIKYSLPLLVAGFLVTTYQSFVYYFGESGSVPCDASGVSCYKQYISEFGGYISIPMLSLTAFFALLVLTLVVHFYRVK